MSFRALATKWLVNTSSPPFVNAVACTPFDAATVNMRKMPYPGAARARYFISHFKFNSPRRAYRTFAYYFSLILFDDTRLI